MGGGRATETAIIQREIALLSRAWRVDLDDIEVKISSRLRSSLGRADLVKARVSIASGAFSNRRLFREILRHELAHIAAARLGAKGEPHHGPTWRKLLLAAGSTPRVRLQNSRRTTRPAVRQFRHECPVCDFSRIAKRRVATWRCADCVEAGLEGLLSITEVS